MEVKNSIVKTTKKKERNWFLTKDKVQQLYNVSEMLKTIIQIILFSVVIKNIVDNVRGYSSIVVNHLKKSCQTYTTILNWYMKLIFRDFNIN